MAEKCVQREDVTLVPQIVDGEGMAEAMWAHVVHASSLTDARKKPTKHITGERSPEVILSHNEDWIILPDNLQSRGYALPDGLTSAFAEIDDALSPLSARALSPDLQVIVAKIQVAERCPAEFRGPNSSVEERQDNGPVAVGRGAMTSDVRSRLPGSREVACLEKRRYLLLRQRFDSRR